MRTNTLTGGLKLLIALTMIPASLVPQVAFAAPAAAKGSKCKPLNTCKTEFTKFRTGQLGINTKPKTAGMEDGAATMVTAGAQTAALAGPAKEACETAKTKCEEEKNSKQKTCTEDDCKAIVAMLGQSSAGLDNGTTAATEGAKTQSAAGAGGGDGAMMGALLGAAAGAGLMMMMQKKKEDETPPPAQMQQQYNGALQANGSIDCSKPDALAYRDCNMQLENRCKTILDDPTCQQFSARYCGAPSGGAATLMAQPQTPPGVQFAVNPATLYGTPGEGMGSAYCRGVMGWNYCKAPGRGACPSCLQIQRNQSPACAQNPALCIAQNSIGEIEKAKTTCPTDPAFADPSFTAGGGAQVPPSVAAGGLPAVVLPQSVGAPGGATVATGSNGSNVIGSSGGGGGGGISTQSAGQAQQANGGNREGYANNGNSQAAYGGGGATGSGAGYSPASAGGANGGGREFASAGGARPQGSTGPTSEIEGQYGPSLFNTSSAVIRRRCQTGRLNNCP